MVVSQTNAVRSDVRDSTVYILPLSIISSVSRVMRQPFSKLRPLSADSTFLNSFPPNFCPIGRCQILAISDPRLMKVSARFGRSMLFREKRWASKPDLCYQGTSVIDNLLAQTRLSCKRQLSTARLGAYIIIEAHPKFPALGQKLERARFIYNRIGIDGERHAAFPYPCC